MEEAIDYISDSIILGNLRIIVKVPESFCIPKDEVTYENKRCEGEVILEKLDNLGYKMLNVDTTFHLPFPNGTFISRLSEIRQWFIDHGIERDFGSTLKTIQKMVRYPRKKVRVIPK
jgi:hypothetical protein